MVTLPAVAVNVAVVAAAGTRTDPGAERAARLLEIATVEPPAEAALDRVTVHVVDVDGFREILAQDRELTDIGGTTEIARDLTPPIKVAVRFEV